MSSKFELTISSDYVKDWGVFQAIRELFQNSIDEEVQNPENKSFFGYDSDTQTLTIGNKCSILNVDSLLLGITTKADDKHTIGQFGEGYKIATMVLLRTGHPITFYNYGAREVWTTKLVKSRRYNGRLVPTFYVDKNFFWQTVPDNNLTITVENITSEEYENICENILPLQKDLGRTLNCGDYGTILLDKKYKGKVFVSGLYVCDNDRINFGYDMTPEYLQLDRDRQTVADFELLWSTSRMWSNYVDIPEFSELFFSEECDDLLYLDTWTNFRNLSNSIETEFYTKYGTNVIPVSSQDEYDRVRLMGGKPVFVTKPVAKCLRSVYDNFTSNVVDSKSCKDMLDDWFYDLVERVDVPEDLKTRFSNILDIYYEQLV